MTVDELILINMHEVRRDSNLMSLYLKYFKETFKYTPSCAGCSFSDDWYRLVRHYSKKEKESLTLQKEKIMSKIEIKKAQAKILSYQKDGMTYRLYDNILTQDFIKDYLTHGSPEELEKRKALFRFPKDEKIEVEKNEKVRVGLVQKDGSIEIYGSEHGLSIIEKGIDSKKPRRRKKKNG